MLELIDVSKNYGPVRALDAVSLTVGPGEIVGLFGENGSGKTTLLRAVLGLVSHGGQVRLDGQDLTRRSMERLSYACAEHSFFPNLTPSAHRDFCRGHFSRWRDGRFKLLMDFFGLPNKPLRTLSAGQQDKFEAVLALSQGADYILMDEPVAGSGLLDRADFYKVLLGILEPGESVILSTNHIPEASGLISRALVMKDGALAGDVLASDLEDQGTDLTSYVRSVCGYDPERVIRALT